MRVVAFADEKLWQAQDALSCFGPDAGAGSGGRLNIQNKDFNWRISVSPIEAESLYRIDLAVDWQEGPRIRGLTRNAYALYIKKEPKIKIKKTLYVTNLITYRYIRKHAIIILILWT